MNASAHVSCSQRRFSAGHSRDSGDLSDMLAFCWRFSCKGITGQGFSLGAVLSWSTPERLHSAFQKPSDQPQVMPEEATKHEADDDLQHSHQAQSSLASVLSHCSSSLDHPCHSGNLIFFDIVLFTVHRPLFTCLLLATSRPADSILLPAQLVPTMFH